MELLTPNLSLAPLDIRRDAPDLHVAYADPAVIGRWLEEAPSAGVEETATRLGQRCELDGAELWTVRRRGDDTALGLVERVGATSPPGMGWMLRRSEWRRGIMAEAARAVVEHLLRADGGADLVEVWAAADNVASLGVARRAGLTERARFSRRGPDGRTRETVVLIRLREERPQDWYTADAVLPVRDVAATVDLLVRALGWHVGFQIGDPPFRAALRLSPWNGCSGVQVAAEPGTILPVTLVVHAGVPVSELYARAEAAGATTEGPPQAMPWGRTEFCIRLPEQHRLCVSGPV